jgi:hypothetical protein
VRRQGCPCPAHQRIRALELANEAGKLATEEAAQVCVSRAMSLAMNGQVVAANEAFKCADAIRRVA